MPVINPIDDNQGAYAAWFNAFANAHGAGGIVSGCSISKGTGDWDIDVTSGTIIESNTEASISAGTVTLTQPSNDADMDAGESRIDLVTANTGDALSVTEGTAASNPTTPDIPSSEVLLGFVHVSNSDSTVADSDIFDVPALIQNNNTLYDGSGSFALKSSFEDWWSPNLTDTLFTTRADDGSVTINDTNIQVRNPGNASAEATSQIVSAAKLWNHIDSGSITVNVSNVTIDNSSNASIRLAIADAVLERPGQGTQNRLEGIIRGDGTVVAATENGGTSGTSTDTTQDNAYVSGLNSIKISWDGSSVTVETKDGTTTVTVSDSSNYPANSRQLFLRIAAFDVDGANARNVDYDIDSIAST